MSGNKDIYSYFVSSIPAPIPPSSQAEIVDNGRMLNKFLKVQHGEGGGGGGKIGRGGSRGQGGGEPRAGKGSRGQGGGSQGRVKGAEGRSGGGRD